MVTQYNMMETEEICGIAGQHSCRDIRQAAGCRCREVKANRRSKIPWTQQKGLAPGKAGPIILSSLLRIRLCTLLPPFSFLPSVNTNSRNPPLTPHPFPGFISLKILGRFVHTHSLPFLTFCPLRSDFYPSFSTEAVLAKVTDNLLAHKCNSLS